MKHSSRLARSLAIFQAFLIQDVVSLMLPEVCATGIHLLLNLLPCGPVPVIGIAQPSWLVLETDVFSPLHSPFSIRHVQRVQRQVMPKG